MDLFTINPEVGQGLVMWLPKGATLRYTLESFLRDELIRRGYEPVYSPHIGSVKLYETSGHFPYYRDSQFPPLYDNPTARFEDIAALEGYEAFLTERLNG